MERFSQIVQRGLLVWLVLFSLLAFFWPKIFENSTDPFVFTKPILMHLIALIMFCIGCLVPKDEVNEVFRQWPAVLGGTLIQYSVMPLLAFTAAHAFELSREFFIGIIMAGCVPGAMASNVLTLAARGNVSYSICLTVSATLLSPLIVPVTLMVALSSQLADSTISFDVPRMMHKLLLTVVLPVIAGHLICRWSEQLRRLVRFPAPIGANAVIIWIIAVVVALNRQRLNDAAASSEVLVLATALLILNLLGYLSGYAGGTAMKLPSGKRRALSIEVGMQNAGLGTVLVLDFFKSEPAAAIPTALYTFGCMFTGTVLAQWWGRKSSDGRNNDDPSAVR